ncbi:MAG: prephenate dehydrogenase/arogenate dehydrogenase family protein [Actinomycetota bacterium]
MNHRHDPLPIMAVVGLGLMGGSLGMAARAAKLVHQVIGFDNDPQTVRKALSMGAITHGAGSLPMAVANASLVVIATPVGSIPEVFREARPALAFGAVVTDLGSTKIGVVEQIAPLVPQGVHFIGGHPMAGSEKEGIEAARADLYRGCLWVLTPTESTSPDAYGQLMRFLTGLQVRVLALDPRRHDEALALTSHLPQLLSSALMGFAAEVASSGEGLPLLTAGGFRDMTRIAASSPEMWTDIVRENRGALLGLVRRFQEAFGSAADALEQGDWEGLRNWFADARTARAALIAQPGIAGAQSLELRVAVPDRPGVIAQIATSVGEVGVNIDDFTIFHTSEGGGLIHLQIGGKQEAAAAREALERKGYKVEVNPAG